MNKIGPRGILDDPKKLKLLKELIIEYDDKRNIKSKIKYKAIFEFVKEKYNEGIIDFHPSETWWKTKGKPLIDEYNILNLEAIIISEKEIIDVVNVKDIVDKHFGNKKELIRHLSSYSKVWDRLYDKLNKLQIYIDKKEKELSLKDSKIIELEKLVGNQQKLIDNLFYEIITSNQSLTSVMKHNKLKSDTINYSLSETFGNPQKYIREFYLRNFNEEKKEKKNNDNVLDFKNTRNKVKITEEDYDY